MIFEGYDKFCVKDKGIVGALCELLNEVQQNEQKRLPKA